MDKNINEREICFVTTTLYSKWLEYQNNIIKDMFPNSKCILIDGRDNWPLSWFYWIEEVKKSECKYFIHIDEDFFITDKDELIKVIKKIDDNDIDIIGCPDGYHEYRGANPIAINTFLMVGRVDKLKDINLSNISFMYGTNGWMNNLGLSFKESYKDDFDYKFTKKGGGNLTFEQEPYYAFLWALKDAGCKFDYLFPHFDDRFKSTNPRVEEDSNDIGIHMWYTREWNSNSDVHGMKNIDRYLKLENEILKK